MTDYFCDSFGVDSACSQRCLYLVFEYMDTTVWHEVARRKGLFDRQLCVSIFADICRGVKHLHDLGIAHTDLSLTNVLYSQGRAKVADLGCSHSAETWVLPRSEKGAAHSAGHRSCGRQPGKKVRRAASRQQILFQTSACALDHWSLGVCLGILLTGQCIVGMYNASRLREGCRAVSKVCSHGNQVWQAGGAGKGSLTLPDYAREHRG